MTDAFPRAILWASAVLAAGMAFVLWRLVRRKSRHTRKVAILTVVALVGLLLVYRIASQRLRNRFGPDREQQTQEVADFVASHRDRIESCGKRLAAIRALVAKDGWLPTGERRHEGDGQVALMFWEQDLAGKESLGGPPVSFELAALDQMVAWAREPATIRDTYEGQSVEHLGRILDRADTRYVVIGIALDVTQPEVRNVAFAKDGTVSGDFSAGKVAFRVGVIDWETGTVVATGNGTAANSDTVQITGAPAVLADDLWRQTNAAALALGRKLLTPGR